MRQRPANGDSDFGFDLAIVLLHGVRLVFIDRLRPFGTGATYVNFLGADEGPGRLAAAYGANLERLRALKRRYDPDGLLRPLG